jgi:hypothetical protein
VRDPKERFLSKVRRLPSGCWEFTGFVVDGYGRFWFEGRPQLAHRVSWKLFKGPLPDDVDLLHGCDNPPCVNPEHLSPGTHLDNMEDSARKGRQRKKLTDELVREIRASTESARAIARRLGLTHEAVGKVRRGKSWRHVE